MSIIRAIALPAFLLAAGLQAQTTYDAKFMEYTGLKYPCGGAVTPVVKIKNIGSATMSGCVVETWKNGIMVASFNWQLAVPALTGETRQPTLPVVPSVGPADDLEFRIISVNTVPDEDPIGNFLPVELDQVPSSSSNTTVTVEVETDADPGDLTWEIRNSLAVVVASGGPYADPNAVIPTNVSLGADACFTFKAMDAGRGTGSAARMRVKSGSNTLITAEGDAMLGGYSKGLTTGHNVGCTQNVMLEFNTDAQPGETSWELIDRGTAAVVCASAGGYAPLESITENCCVAAGCYHFRMMDSGGDGITGGAYLLRTSTGQRLIDAKNAMQGNTGQIDGGDGFCLPLSTDKVIFTSCDKLDWVSGQYIVATANPAVSALWSAANTPAEGTTGYEFWFFNPNGGYSFRKFRSHAVSDGFSPDNASRACHLKINNWALASQIPANVLMNVSVRSRVNGVNGAYGPVCRFMIDPVRAACPYTKLLDTPGNEYLSCGSIRNWGAGNYVHARPVSGANKYQFRFRASGGFEVVRTSNTYFVQLNWLTSPLQNGVVYNVDVRASKNGGLSWCTDPAPVSNAWGDVCQLTIGGAVQSGDHNMAAEQKQLRMFPNPNANGQLYVQLEAIEEDVKTVSIDIFDLFGKRVSARTIAVNDGFINTVIDLPGDMANGMYLVNIGVGSVTYAERLVVQR